MALGYARDGQVALARGYGVADLASRRPVTADTVFPLASVTKTVTATAVMQLVEQGRLQLDEAVAPHLGFPLANRRHPAAPITVRQLLTHTSGLSDAKYYAIDFRTAGADATLGLEALCSPAIWCPAARSTTATRASSPHPPGAAGLQQHRLRAARPSRRADRRRGSARPHPPHDLRAARHGQRRLDDRRHPAGPRGDRLRSPRRPADPGRADGLPRLPGGHAACLGGRSRPLRRRLGQRRCGRSARGCWVARRWPGRSALARPRGIARLAIGAGARLARPRWSTGSSCTITRAATPGCSRSPSSAPRPAKASRSSPTRPRRAAKHGGGQGDRRAGLRRATRPALAALAGARRRCAARARRSERREAAAASSRRAWSR